MCFKPDNYIQNFLFHSSFSLFYVFASRKRLTDWDTDITPLVGEELLVEVLDDIPLTMHNFVSSWLIHSHVYGFFEISYIYL